MPHGGANPATFDTHIVTWQYGEVTIELEAGLKALANDRRLQILEWLKDPTAHFRPQVDGDLVKDGVCGLLITEKLGVSQPTASEHLRVLADAGFLTGKRIKQWIFYRRDEKEIVAFKALLKKRI
jgi:ArsR family transcriptional regulator